MKNLIKQLNRGWWMLFNSHFILKGFLFARAWKTPLETRSGGMTYENPLRMYFTAHTKGRGLIKWDHYFDVYHRHLSKFVGKEVHVLEIGVHSGGSILAWKEYFGPQCYYYGVDIQEVCKKFEDKKENVKIFIGDQGNRQFLKSLKEQIPRIDVLLDDGSHNTKDQIATFEEMLPHLAPGSIYLCEDVKRVLNGFAFYLEGLTINLNALSKKDARDTSTIISTPFQKEISSVHFYPFITIIEKNQIQKENLKSMRHGTEWEKIS